MENLALFKCFLWIFFFFLFFCFVLFLVMSYMCIDCVILCDCFNVTFLSDTHLECGHFFLKSSFRVTLLLLVTHALNVTFVTCRFIGVLLNPSDLEDGYILSFTDPQTLVRVRRSLPQTDIEQW